MKLSKFIFFLLFLSINTIFSQIISNKNYYEDISNELIKTRIQNINENNNINYKKETIRLIFDRAYYIRGLNPDSMDENFFKNNGFIDIAIKLCKEILLENEDYEIMFYLQWFYFMKITRTDFYSVFDAHKIWKIFANNINNNYWTKKGYILGLFWFPSNMGGNLEYGYQMSLEFKNHYPFDTFINYLNIEYLYQKNNLEEASNLINDIENNKLYDPNLERIKNNIKVLLNKPIVRDIKWISTGGVNKYILEKVLDIKTNIPFNTIELEKLKSNGEKTTLIGGINLNYDYDEYNNNVDLLINVWNDGSLKYRMLYFMTGFIPSISSNGYNFYFNHFIPPLAFYDDKNFLGIGLEWYIFTLSFIYYETKIFYNLFNILDLGYFVEIMPFQLDTFKDFYNTNYIEANMSYNHHTFYIGRKMKNRLNIVGFIKFYNYDFGSNNNNNYILPPENVNSSGLQITYNGWDYGLYGWTKKGFFIDLQLEYFLQYLYNWGFLQNYYQLTNVNKWMLSIGYYFNINDYINLQLDIHYYDGNGINPLNKFVVGKSYPQYRNSEVLKIRGLSLNNFNAETVIIFNQLWSFQFFNKNIISGFGLDTGFIKDYTFLEDKYLVQGIGIFSKFWILPYDIEFHIDFGMALYYSFNNNKLINSELQINTYISKFWLSSY